MLDYEIIHKHLKDLKTTLTQLSELKKYNLSELENELKKL